MTIHDCIMGGVTVITQLTEPYYMIVSGMGDIESISPVNVHVKSVDYPISKENLLFDYSSHIEENVRRSFGTFRFDTYYPVGSEINLNGTKVRVISYAEPTRNKWGKDEYYVYTEVAFIDLIPHGKVTNEAIETETIKAINTILYVNDNIKNMLPKYRDNIVEFIGNPINDYYQAVAIFGSIADYEDTINTGYKEQMSYYMESIPFIWQNLKTEVREYRKFYDYDHKLTLAAKDVSNLDTVSANSKAFISWLDNLVVNNNEEELNTELIELSNEYNLNTTIGYKYLADKTVIIVLYTPAACSYNIVLRFTPDTFIDDFDRLYPVYGVGIINKNITYSTTVDVPFRTIQYEDADDTWGQVAYILSELSNHDSSSTEDMITFLNGEFKELLTEKEPIVDMDDTTFTRSSEDDLSNFGKLKVGNETFII